VQVRYDEGLADHIGPKPCVVSRERQDEASAGVRIGQPLSRESSFSPGADTVTLVEGDVDECDGCECSSVLAWSETLACA
jgi:hypothetical protein